MHDPFHEAPLSEIWKTPLVLLAVVIAWLPSIAAVLWETVKAAR